MEFVNWMIKNGDKYRYRPVTKQFTDSENGVAYLAFFNTMSNANGGVAVMTVKQATEAEVMADKRNPLIDHLKEAPVVTKLPLFSSFLAKASVLVNDSTWVRMKTYAAPGTMLKVAPEGAPEGTFEEVSMETVIVDKYTYALLTTGDIELVMNSDNTNFGFKMRLTPLDAAQTKLVSQEATGAAVAESEQERRARIELVCEGALLGFNSFITAFGKHLNKQMGGDEIKANHFKRCIRNRPLAVTTAPSVYNK